jgi:hypothetical protein
LNNIPFFDSSHSDEAISFLIVIARSLDDFCFLIKVYGDEAISLLTVIAGSLNNFPFFMNLLATKQSFC